VAFNRYITLLSEPLRWIGFIVNRIARAIASGGRIFEILDTKSAIQDSRGAVRLNPMRGEVTFEDVSFRYAGAKRDALADLFVHRAAGRDDRPPRPDRRGEEHDHQPPAALLRCHGRADPDRRP
jgi:ATP-binding cassette subfamily B protein